MLAVRQRVPDPELRLTDARRKPVQVRRRGRLTRIIRAFTPPIIWELLRVLRMGVLTRSLRRYYGLNGLDAKLEKFVDFDGGVFVELGAADGVAQSNTLYLAKRRGWRGLLIEPVPHKYLACKKNRPESTVVCAACVPYWYDREFVRLTYCNLMTTAERPAGFRNDLPNLERHFVDGIALMEPHEDPFDFGAVARPLSSILLEHGIERCIDLLSVDVEGLEMGVLHGLDLRRHRPRVICVEAWDVESVRDYLCARGYVLAEKISELDCVFVDRHATASVARATDTGFFAPRGRVYRAGRRGPREL